VPLLRRYWAAVIIIVVGAAVTLAVGLVTGDVRSLLWMGGVIGVGAGMVIAATQRRTPPPRAKRRR